jgi:predicted GIY-YIG superfamily endonuclease
MSDRITLTDCFKLGFKEIGSFTLDDQLEFKMVDRLHNINGCYIMFSGNDVFYVGETSDGILTRMGQYRRSSPSQKTSKRVNLELLNALKNLDKVSIAFLEEEDIHRLSIDIHNQVRLSCDRQILERVLIKALSPNWNRR